MVPDGMAGRDHLLKYGAMLHDVVADTKEGPLCSRFPKGFQNKLRGAWNRSIVKGEIEHLVLRWNPPRQLRIQPGQKSGCSKKVQRNNGYGTDTKVIPSSLLHPASEHGDVVTVAVTAFKSIQADNNILVDGIEIPVMVFRKILHEGSLSEFLACFIDRFG